MADTANHILNESIDTPEFYETALSWKENSPDAALWSDVIDKINEYAKREVASALASRPAEVDDEGKADAKRLDWLESANLTFCGNYSNTGFRAIGSSMWHGTLREAIDGAMFEAGASPSCTTSAGAT